MTEAYTAEAPSQFHTEEQQANGQAGSNNPAEQKAYQRGHQKGYSRGINKGRNRQGNRGGGGGQSGWGQGAFNQNNVVQWITMGACFAAGAMLLKSLGGGGNTTIVARPNEWR